MSPLIAASSVDYPLTFENISPYPLHHILRHERMTAEHPDKDTKESDYDHICVTAGWCRLCRELSFMPKVEKAVGPHVTHWSH